MAYERYGRDDPRSDRDEYGYSSARDYQAAGELGGYGRENQREYGQRDQGQRDQGQRGYGQRDQDRQGYGSRDWDRQNYGAGSYGQRDHGASDYGQTARQGRGGQGGDRDRFTGGSDYYRGGEQGRQAYGGQGFGNQGYGAQGRDTYRQSRGTYDRQPQTYDRDDRGFLDRAGDEVRSWFGDEDAERRREQDARAYERETGRGGDHGRDDHYHSWRSEQLRAFDRDYDEYRQENRSKFHNEFSSWRTERQGQRDLLPKVTEHQEVVGSDGAHVGTVDKVRGDRVILTKSDADAGGRHHSFPSRWIKSVDDKVTLSKTADDAKQHWRDEERQGAMFSDSDRDRSNDNRDDSGTNLNRSFSGTY